MASKHKGRGRQNNRDTFDGIVEKYGSMLWRTAASYELNPDRRDELYQEILLAVWKALPRFRKDANLRTYLARVAHNRGVTHVIRETKEPPTVSLDAALPSASLTPQEEFEANDRWQRLLASIQCMPLVSRQVVTLTLEGFTPRDIAGVLGVSANVVSIRLSRAKKNLCSAVEEKGR